MSTYARSRGITLIMVMIFLVLISMLSISAFRAGTSNMRITQNMAVRQEATDAAQAAIETTISTSAFQAATAASNVASTVNVDVDGDGSNDYAVTVRAGDRCTKVRTLRNDELPKEATTGLPTTAWIRCDSGSAGRAAGSGAGGSGLIEGGTSTGQSTGNSFCVETLWNVSADAVDSRSGTTVQVNQGVAVPYSVGESKDRCERNN